MRDTETQPMDICSSFTVPKTNMYRIKLMLIYVIMLGITIVGMVAIYLQQPPFATPQVPNGSYNGKFYDGIFHNTVDVPVVTVEENPVVGLYKFLTEKQLDDIPEFNLPSVKTDLKHLDINENIIVWMGHSSYYIQLDGARILVDPVFSDNASPVPYTNIAFAGSNIYSASDIPDIDYLLITHDHWDHLDYPTIDALREKINKIITPVGVGSYFTNWGFNKEQIFEGDWFSSTKQNNLEVVILPAQHFSGRLLNRNQTLWGSFALITDKHKIYLGGDSGYGKHYKETSDKFGEFDIAILEAGQYNQDWPYIHMMPEETAQAAVDLKAKALLPSHNSKFKLARHAWYEPLNRIQKASINHPFKLLTPRIGERVEVDNHTQTFTSWWKSQ